MKKTLYNVQNRYIQLVFNKTNIRVDDPLRVGIIIIKNFIQLKYYVDAESVALSDTQQTVLIEWCLTNHVNGNFVKISVIIIRKL